MQLTKTYHLARLWIELTRELSRAGSPESHAQFGTRAGDLLLRAAIYVGTVEGRPLTAAKLATYVGMSRPTVVRHLRALERGGMVVRNGRTWSTTKKLVERRRQQEFSQIIRIVHNANERLKNR